MSNPFLKFRTYEESNASSFLGRDNDVRDMIELIQGSQISVCYSDSGIGKSSLINAGICPKLRRQNYFPLFLLFDKVSSSQTFDSVILKVLNNPIALSKIWKNAKDDSYKIILSDRTEQELKDSVKTSVEGNKQQFVFESIIPEDAEILLELDKELSSTSLWWFLRTRVLVSDINEYVPLFIFDQFEELFDKCEDFNYSGSFFAWLKQLVEPIVPAEIQSKYLELSKSYIEQGKSLASIPNELEAKFLFSIRREYIGQLDYWTVQRNDTLLLSFQKNRYFLRPLSKDQAIEIITRNGKDDTLDGWTEQILSCAKEKNDGFSTMLISVICHDIYDDSSAYEQVFEYHDDFESLDDYILARIYDKAISASGIKKKHIKIIENNLVDDYGKRRRVYSDDDNYKLAHIKDINVIVNALAEQGVIKCTKDNNKSRLLIELVHDKIADVVLKKRRVVNRHKTINSIKGYAILIVAVLAMLTFFGVWFPGIFNWKSSIAHGCYPASSNPYYYGYNGNSFKTTDIIKINDLSFYAKNIIVDNRKYDINQDKYPELQEITIPDYISNTRIDFTKDPLKQYIIDIQSDSISLYGNVSNLDIKIGKNVKYLYFPSYYEHDNISFIVSEENRRYTYEDKILWDTISAKIVFAQENADSLVIFPHTLRNDTVLQWGNKSFYNLPLFLTDEVVPDIISDTLKSVSLKAKGKMDLSQYHFSVVDKKAFGQCAYIDTIILPNSVKEIKDFAFYGCSLLKRVNLDELSLLNTVGNSVFENCYSLDSIVFPSSSSIMIGDSTFVGCQSLEYLKYPNICTKVDLDGLEYNHGLTVVLPSKANSFCSYSKYSNFNLLLGETKDSKLKKECEGLISLCEDTTKTKMVDYIATGKWKNFSDTIINKLKGIDSTYKYEDGILYKENIVEYLNIDHLKTGKYRRKLDKIGKKSFGINYHGGYLVFSDADDKIFVLKNRTNTIQFANISPLIEELHIPNANAKDLEIIGLDRIKKDITLYVPWNCKSEYLKYTKYRGFKEIKEDTLKDRVFSIFAFYTRNAFDYLIASPLLAILLVILIMGVAVCGCAVIVSMLKNKKLPKSKLHRKVLFIFIKMIALTIVGYMVSYWFFWIVIFDSIKSNTSSFVSNFVGVIMAFILPWLWIFCEELDYQKLKLILKTVPTTISAWIKTMLYLSFNGIKKANKHWKTIMPIILALILILICIDKIQTKNNQIRDRIEQWETGNEQERDSVLLELVSIYPDIQSVFCPEELTIKYDSIIDYAYDLLENTIYFDTIVAHNVTKMYDASQKLVYIESSPITRYDIKNNCIDTLTISKILPNGKTIDFYKNNVDCVNGCIYYLNEVGLDTLSINKLSNLAGSCIDTEICKLPKNERLDIESANLEVSEDEGTVVIYGSSYYDILQCWDINLPKKTFELAGIRPKYCHIDKNKMYFFEYQGDSIVEVSLADKVSAKTVFRTRYVNNITISDAGHLLLTDTDDSRKGYHYEIGIVDTKKNSYNKLLRHTSYLGVIDNNALYFATGGSLLKYELTEGIPTSIKLEKIKSCLLHYK